jgi:nicotinamidase-related amidase
MQKSGLSDADALLIIDMQVGFLHGQNQFIGRIERLTSHFPAEKTYWLKYRNEPGSLYSRHLDWDEFMVPPQTELVPPFKPAVEQIFEHFSYSPSVDLLARLEGCKEVALAGVDTDACVQAAAFTLWDHDIRPLILSDYCMSSGGAHFHNTALDLMRRQFGVGSILQARL